jgi:cobalamin-dependent methionine synthase I
MLQEFIAEKPVTLNGMVGIYPANAVGDDIEIYTDESRTTVRGTLFGLREQCEKDSKTAPCAACFMIACPQCMPPHIGFLGGGGVERMSAQYSLCMPSLTPCSAFYEVFACQATLYAERISRL